MCIKFECPHINQIRHVPYAGESTHLPFCSAAAGWPFLDIMEFLKTNGLLQQKPETHQLTDAMLNGAQIQWPG